jgi:hypothetical protein
MAGTAGAMVRRGVCSASMMPDDAWLAAVWEAVRSQLPAPPASVVEVGCGPLGGLVPVLRSAGYTATGVDPAAPRGSWYCPVEFERYDMPEPADAIVACTSLHHVADLTEVTDRLAEALAPGGLLVVVEWARERFDETTARWCFDRLPQPGDDSGWRTHSGAPQASRGTPTSNPGPNPKACTPGEISSARLVHDSTPGRTSSPTWRASAKLTSRPRSTEDTSRPAASDTPGDGEAVTRSGPNVRRRMRAGTDPHRRPAHSPGGHPPGPSWKPLPHLGPGVDGRLCRSRRIIVKRRGLRHRGRRLSGAPRPWRCQMLLVAGESG